MYISFIFFFFLLFFAVNGFVINHPEGQARQKNSVIERPALFSLSSQSFIWGTYDDCSCGLVKHIAGHREPAARKARRCVVLLFVSIFAQFFHFSVQRFFPLVGGLPLFRPPFFALKELIACCLTLVGLVLSDYL